MTHVLTMCVKEARGAGGLSYSPRPDVALVTLSGVGSTLLSDYSKIREGSRDPLHSLKTNDLPALTVDGVFLYSAQYCTQMSLGHVVIMSGQIPKGVTF